MDKTQDLFITNMIDWRERKGFTQDRMAEKVGVNLRTYQKYEYKQTFPTIETVGKIADALGISVAVLFTEANAASKSKIADSYLDTINAQAAVLEEWSAISKKVPPEILTAMSETNWDSAKTGAVLAILTGRPASRASTIKKSHG